MDQQFIAEGGVYHRACFKCNHGKEQLSLITFAAYKGARPPGAPARPLSPARCCWLARVQ